MHKIKLLSLTIVFTIIVGMVVPQSIYACSCAVRNTEELFRESDAVFHGQVIDVKPDPDSPQNIATFVFVSVYKGEDFEKGDEVSLTTSTSSASCGVEFKEGEEWLVYANIKENELSRTISTNLCNGNSPLGDLSSPEKDKLLAEVLAISEGNTGNDSDEELLVMEKRLESLDLRIEDIANRSNFVMYLNIVLLLVLIFAGIGSVIWKLKPMRK